MKLAKLLAAGKSFVVAGDRAHRYRLNRVSLPRFLSPRNPFAPSPPADSPSVEKKTPDFAAATDRCRAAQTGSAQGLATGPVGRMVRRVRQWLRELRGRIARGRKAGRAAPPDGWIVPAQREFSLDQVRVVRNDLRDEDIEIVVARPAGGARVAEGKAAPAARWGVVGRAWERLSNRFSTATQG